MGALNGVKVVEMAGIGPAPFCGMLLADMGADVLRIDRLVASDIGIPVPPKFDLLNRNKRSVALDLKSEYGREALLRLIAAADILIEGFRPGVMERLGLGPDVCLERNAALVFGRMTGWGQTGPLSHSASHDINYIALSGALNAIGRAHISAQATGVGQVVDAAVTDGVANLLTMHYGFRQAGVWSLERGSNLTDGGAPFYDVYETRDGLFVSVGAVEGKFFTTLLNRLGIADEELPSQDSRQGWTVIRRRLTDIFKSRTRAEWCAILEGSDACFAPVLDMDECVNHPHHLARRAHVEFEGVTHPSPAPRFSVTPSNIRKGPPVLGEDTKGVLAEWGFSKDEIESLQRNGAIA
jgi:alpha-methylacyl-CoA racemase